MVIKTNKSHPSSLPRIGIDFLGSDTAADFLFKAVLKELEALKDQAHFTLFGTKDLYLKVPCPSYFQCIPVTELITMEDDPLLAVRRKKDASIPLGIKMLKNMELDAFITAGNTGALIASSQLHLSMLPGIKRPALMTLLPTKKKPVAVLDVGANIQVTDEQLMQFALMGIAYQKTREIPHPTVGLLNIGTEEKKGTPERQSAYQHLQKLNQNAPFSQPVFIGNIEGRDVFQGDIDVLVTDGFSGNIFLKTAEGLAAYILEEINAIAALETSSELKQILSNLHHRMHYSEYPGAILCGVEAIVIKCHGNVLPISLINSTKGAIRLIEHFFLEKIKSEMHQ